MAENDTFDKQVQKEYPHLVSNATSVGRKMGFPDVIMPGKLVIHLQVELCAIFYTFSSSTTYIMHISDNNSYFT